MGQLTSGLLPLPHLDAALLLDERLGHRQHYDLSTDRGSEAFETRCRLENESLCKVCVPKNKKTEPKILPSRQVSSANILFMTIMTGIKDANNQLLD